MFIGERCALDECHREDFLPFKCADCRESFCGSHFRPASHRCTKHDDSSGDYRVPLCPLCDTPPEGWKRDEDPNIAMDRHLSSGKCPALDANGLVKNRTSSSKATAAPAIHAKKPNECAFKKCSKVMVVPIQVRSQQPNFCHPRQYLTHCPFSSILCSVHNAALPSVPHIVLQRSTAVGLHPLHHQPDSLHRAAPQASPRVQPRRSRSVRHLLATGAQSHQIRHHRLKNHRLSLL